MLRIEMEQHGDLFTIALHGSVAGDWVAVLDRCWQRIADTLPSPRVKAVLTDVSFIDPDGEQLLERMSRRGVELVGTGCMNRHVIDRIRRRCGTRRTKEQGDKRGGAESE
jgi:hypothetical protein